VLIMYLWAALFSVTVVSLSIVRSPSVVFLAATLVAVLALLPATMPRLRPWRSAARNSAARNSAARSRTAPALATPAMVPAVTRPSGPAVNGAAPSGHGTLPAYTRDAAPFPGDSRPPDAPAVRADPLVPADPLPRAGRLPGADPLTGHAPFPAQGPFPAQPPFPGTAPFPVAEPEPRPDQADARDSLPQTRRPDARPRP